MANIQQLWCAKDFQVLMTQEVLSILQNLLLPTEVGDNIVLPHLLFVRFILICHASSPSCQDTHQSPNIKKKKHLIPMLSTQNCFSFYCMILRILIPGVFPFWVDYSARVIWAAVQLFPFVSALLWCQSVFSPLTFMLRTGTQELALGQIWTLSSLLFCRAGIQDRDCRWELFQCFSSRTS